MSALGNGQAGCLWPQSDTELVHIPITVVGHYVYLEYMQQEAHSLWDFWYLFHDSSICSWVGSYAFFWMYMYNNVYISSFLILTLSPLSLPLSLPHTHSLFLSPSPPPLPPPSLSSSSSLNPSQPLPLPFLSPQHICTGQHTHCL